MTHSIHYLHSKSYTLLKNACPFSYTKDGGITHRQGKLQALLTGTVVWAVHYWALKCPCFFPTVNDLMVWSSHLPPLALGRRETKSTLSEWRQLDSVVVNPLMNERASWPWYRYISVRTKTVSKYHDGIHTSSTSSIEKKMYLHIGVLVLCISSQKETWDFQPWVFLIDIIFFITVCTNERYSPSRLTGVESGKNRKAFLLD
jgi:hypothetical protein